MAFDSNSEIRNRRLITLDGMRGIAALFIFCGHFDDFFPFKVDESFLAVDLFFLLSGFVVEKSYGQKISNGLSGFDFLKIRTIRFYPLCFMAGFFGLLLPMESILAHGVNRLPYFFKILPNIFLIPSLFGVDALFPLNRPAWSLLFELIINTFYGFFRKKFIFSMVASIVIFTSLCLIFIDAYRLGINGGFNSDPFSLAIGAVRVTFSFCFGVVLSRFPEKNIPKINPLFLIAILMIFLGWDTAILNGPSFEILFVLIFSPLLVLLGSANDPKSKLLIPIFSFLGIASYPIYIIQAPLVTQITLFSNYILKINLGNYNNWVGYLFIILFISFGIFLDKFYDAPLRRYLKFRLIK